MAESVNLRHVLIISVLFISLIVVSIFINQYEINTLKIDGEISQGQVVNVTGPSHKSRQVFVDYYFEIENISHLCYKTNLIKISNIEKKMLIDKYFPVIYSTENPKINRMLISKEDFEIFGLTFPDSLRKYSRINFTQLK